MLTTDMPGTTYCSFDEGFNHANIKASLKAPLYQLLSQYNICFHYFNLRNNNNSGFFIGNGIIHICSGKNILSLEHELAHLSLIKNYEKLLITNFGMAVTSQKSATPKIARKWLKFEAKVWGHQSFIKDSSREISTEWCRYASAGDEQLEIQLYNDAVKICTEAKDKASDEKILSNIKNCFDFLDNHLKQYPNFSSREFKWFKD